MPMNQNKKNIIGIVVLVVVAIVATLLYKKNTAFVTYNDPSGLYSFERSPSWKAMGGGNGTVPAATQVTLPGKNKITGETQQIILFVDINDTLLSQILREFPTKKEVGSAFDGYATDKYTSTPPGPASPVIYSIHLREATSTKISLIAFSANYDAASLLATLKVDKNLIDSTAQKVQAVLAAAIENARIKEAASRK
jgi:hypothetical protein